MKTFIAIVLANALFISVVWNLALQVRRDNWVHQHATARKDELARLEKERAVVEERRGSIATREKTLRDIHHWTEKADTYLAEKKLEKELRTRSAELELMRNKAGVE